MVGCCPRHQNDVCVCLATSVVKYIHLGHLVCTGESDIFPVGGILVCAVFTPELLSTVGSVLQRTIHSVQLKI